MKVRKIITIKRDEVVEVICNKCGALFECNDDGFRSNLIHGFNIMFGYGSPHDLEKWEFDLCETCIGQLVDSFEIKPTRFEVGPFGESYGREIK